MLEEQKSFHFRFDLLKRLLHREKQKPNLNQLLNEN